MCVYIYTHICILCIYPLIANIHIFTRNIHSVYVYIHYTYPNNLFSGLSLNTSGTHMYVWGKKKKTCHKKASLQAINCQHGFITAALATCKKVESLRRRSTASVSRHGTACCPRCAPPPRSVAPVWPRRFGHGRSGVTRP